MQKRRGHPLGGLAGARVGKEFRRWPKTRNTNHLVLSPCDLLFLRRNDCDLRSQRQPRGTPHEGTRATGLIDRVAQFFRPAQTFLALKFPADINSHLAAHVWLSEHHYRRRHRARVTHAVGQRKSLLSNTPIECHGTFICDVSLIRTLTQRRRECR